jgi:hypothetical protein
MSPTEIRLREVVARAGGKIERIGVIGSIAKRITFTTDRRGYDAARKVAGVSRYKRPAYNEFTLFIDL